MSFFQFKLNMLAVFSTALILTSPSYAEGDNGARVNSKASIDACKAYLAEEDFAGKEHKFKRSAATKVNATAYTHWINAIVTGDGGRASVKVLCETTRTGRVTSIQVQEGRWKF